MSETADTDGEIAIEEEGTDNIVPDQPESIKKDGFFDRIRRQTHDVFHHNHDRKDYLERHKQHKMIDRHEMGPLNHSSISDRNDIDRSDSAPTLSGSYNPPGAPDTTMTTVGLSKSRSYSSLAGDFEYSFGGHESETLRARKESPVASSGPLHGCHSSLIGTVDCVIVGNDPETPVALSESRRSATPEAKEASGCLNTGCQSLELIGTECFPTGHDQIHSRAADMTSATVKHTEIPVCTCDGRKKHGYFAGQPRATLQRSASTIDGYYEMFPERHHFQMSQTVQNKPLGAKARLPELAQYSSDESESESGSDSGADSEPQGRRWYFQVVSGSDCGSETNNFLTCGGGCGPGQQGGPLLRRKPVIPDPSVKKQSGHGPVQARNYHREVSRLSYRHQRLEGFLRRFWERNTINWKRRFIFGFCGLLAFVILAFLLLYLCCVLSIICNESRGGHGTITLPNIVVRRVKPAAPSMVRRGQGVISSLPKTLNQIFKKFHKK